MPPTSPCPLPSHIRGNQSPAAPAALPQLHFQRCAPRYLPCSPGDALGQRGIPRARLWDRGFNSKHTGAVSKSCFFCTFTIIRDFARGPCCEAEAGCDPKPGGSAPALVRVGAFWQHPDGPAPRRGGCVSGGVMSAPAPDIQGKLGQLQPPGAGEGKTTLCSGSRGLSGMPFSSSPRLDPFVCTQLRCHAAASKDARKKKNTTKTKKTTWLYVAASRGYGKHTHLNHKEELITSPRSPHALKQL